MTDDLVKRLRDWQNIWTEDENKPEGHLYKTAADRIEELEAKLAKSLAFLGFLDENYRHVFGDTARAKIRELHAELKGNTP